MIDKISGLSGLSGLAGPAIPIWPVQRPCRTWPQRRSGSVPELFRRDHEKRSAKA
jgi:hypothetical protein